MLFRAILMVAASAVLSSCAATTDFVEQSNGYNGSASYTNDQQLLLNIVRSSYNRPTEFTAVQSATGTSTLSAGLSITSALSALATPSGMGSTTGSVSSAVSNTVLDTREFISGIRTAVPATVINDYFQEGYAKAVLFNLFFDRIIIYSTRPSCLGIRQHLINCEFSFENNPRSPRQFAQFQTVMRYLLHLGFTLETVRYLPPEGLKPSDKPNPISDGAHFCFRPRTPRDVLDVPDPKAQCRPLGVVYTPPPTSTPPSVGLGIRLDDVLVANLEEDVQSYGLEPGHYDEDDTNKALMSSLQAMKRSNVSLGLRIRSPVAILEYLGSVVSAYRKRGQLVLIDLDNAGGNDFKSCLGGEEGCVPLFMVLNDVHDPSGLTVSFNGLQHTIPGGNVDVGATYYVMSIMRQLLALSLSAKDLPAPAVLTLVP